MRIIVLILLAGFCCLQASAQYGYTFHRIGREDGLGLASDMVYTAYQDYRGFIWVGTSNGLQRFDGNKFIQFGNTNSNKTPISDLTQILPADSNTLWLYYASRKEIGRFNTTTFQYTVVPLETKSPLGTRTEYKLWKDSKGATYITILKYGILKYNPQLNKFNDDTPFNFPKGWIPTHGHFEDKVKQRIWFPCFDSGLAVYDRASKQIFTAKNNPQKIPLLNNSKFMPGVSEFFIDNKRRHWIFNWKGIHMKHCFNEAGIPLKDTAGLSSIKEYAEIGNFFETSKGVLWTYGNNALFNFNSELKRFYFYDNQTISEFGIQYQKVFQLIEDRDEGIWVCTDNGLYYTSPGSGTFGVVNMLFNEKKGGIEITDLIELKSGQYWLTTWGQGLITLNKQFNKYDAGIYKNKPFFDPVRNIQYQQTWALYQHSDGKVWIGCQGGNFMIYDTLRKTTQFLSNPVFEAATIRYITNDKQGNIWFGTQRGHLIKFDGKSFSQVQRFGAIITKILVDNEGLLWVPVSNDGLYCLSKDGKKILHHYTSSTPTNKLFINSGADIEQLNDSIIVFTAGPMNFINKKTGKVTWLTFDDGLPSNTIHKIRIDREGNLWMITSNGLCKYNQISKHVTTYNRKDGITLSRLTTEADYLCSKGYVMFAGSNGLMFFQPTFFKTSKPANVVITDFKLFNSYLPVDSLLSLPQVKLNSNQNTFSIYFSALSYGQKEKLTYYYKLDGINKDWIKADRQFFASYSLLPPGKYVFNVYCENIEGIRCSNITSFPIYIKPPTWQTRWFISTMLLLLALIIYAVHRARVNKLLAVEKIRTRVARDLHDDMGSTLSTINILSSMAKSKISTDIVKTNEFISKISDNSQRMMEAMDDIVWSIKPSNDSMQKITARMREFATNVLEAKEIELSFLADEDVYNLKLNMEARRDLFLVFKEAVNNAAKYSKATKVAVTIAIQNKQVQLRVQDNGIGFDVSKADNGNGLSNMHKRTDAMNGKIIIQSAEGKGTEVIITVPVN